MIMQYLWGAGPDSSIPVIVGDSTLSHFSVVTDVILRSAFLPGMLLFFGATGVMTLLFFPALLPLPGIVALKLV